MCHGPLLGFVLSFANAFMFTLSNVLVKRASALDTFSICIFRFGYIALHALPVNVYFSYDPFPSGDCTVMMANRICPARRVAYSGDIECKVTQPSPHLLSHFFSCSISM